MHPIHPINFAQDPSTYIELQNVTSIIHKLKSQIFYPDCFVFLLAERLRILCNIPATIPIRKDFSLFIIETLTSRLLQKEIVSILLTPIFNTNTLFSILLSESTTTEQLQIIKIILHICENHCDDIYKLLTGGNSTHPPLHQLLQRKEISSSISLALFKRIHEKLDRYTFIQLLQYIDEHHNMLLFLFLHPLQVDDYAQLLSSLFSICKDEPHLLVQLAQKQNTRKQSSLIKHIHQESTPTTFCLQFVRSCIEHLPLEQTLNLLKITDNTSSLLKALFIKTRKAECIDLLDLLIPAFNQHEDKLITELVKNQDYISLLCSIVARDDAPPLIGLQIVTKLSKLVNEKQLLRILSHTDAVGFSFLHFLMYRSQEDTVIQILHVLFSSFSLESESFFSLLLDERTKFSCIELFFVRSDISSNTCHLLFQTFARYLSTEQLFQVLQLGTEPTVFEIMLEQTKQHPANTPTNCVSLIAHLLKRSYNDANVCFQFFMQYNKNSINPLHSLFQNNTINPELCLPLMDTLITYFHPEQLLQLLESTDKNHNTLLFFITKSAQYKDSPIILQKLTSACCQHTERLHHVFRKNNFKNNTLLHSLIISRHVDAAQTLVELLPPELLSLMNTIGHTPCSLAYQLGYTNIYQAIVRKTCSLEQDLYAITHIHARARDVLELLCMCPQGSLQLEHVKWALQTQTLAIESPDFPSEKNEVSIIPYVLERTTTQITTHDILDIIPTTQPDRAAKMVLEWWVKHRLSHQFDPIDLLFKRALFHQCHQEIISVLQHKLSTAWQFITSCTAIEKAIDTFDEQNLKNLLRHTSFASIPDNLVKKAITQGFDISIIYKIISKAENITTDTLQKAIDRSYEPEILCDLIDKLNSNEAQNTTILMNHTYSEFVQEKIMENFINKVFRNKPTKRFVRTELLYPELFFTNQKNN